MNPKTKNICFFNSCKTWGGGEKWHHDIALKMHNKGYFVLTFTNKRSELSVRLKMSGIPVFQISIHNLSFLNIFKIIHIYRLLKSNNINVIILGLPSDVKIAGIAAKLAGVTKIIYRRGTALPVKNSFLNRFIFRKVITDVITNSIEIKKKFLERNPNLFPEKSIHVIYNGIDINGIPLKSYKINGANKQVILGNAGRLVEQKGQKYLIELAALLKEQNIDFKIIIAGKGPLKNNLLAYSKKLDVENKIEFLDFVFDMDKFFKTIDIFLLPSIHEGSANIVMEAMAHAKPVIAFNTSSMPEIIENGKTGFLVEFKNIVQYSEKVIYLIQNSQFRKEMGENAYNLLLSNFDLNKNLNKLEQILN